MLWASALGWGLYSLDLLVSARLPQTCVLLPADERELCKGWGVRNLREAEEVLLRRRTNTELNHSPNFVRLVLGGINADL